MHDDDHRTPNEVMAEAQAKLRRPDYGTMDRDAIWDEAVRVLTEHFGTRYDVHYNSAIKRVCIIDREPGNPHGRGGSRLTAISDTTWRND